MKRKQKTYQQLLLLEKDELEINEETGIVLYLEPNVELRTYEQMLAGFYRANHNLRPISFKMVEDRWLGIPTKDWYAVMYRGWHIRITKGNETGGPHLCELWYKSGTEKKAFWIATLQLMAFFFNEKHMLDALLLAIKQKEFFLTEHEKQYQLQP